MQPVCVLLAILFVDCLVLDKVGRDLNQDLNQTWNITLLYWRQTTSRGQHTSSPHHICSPVVQVASVAVPTVRKTLLLQESTLCNLCSSKLSPPGMLEAPSRLSWVSAWTCSHPSPFLCQLEGEPDVWSPRRRSIRPGNSVWWQLGWLPVLSHSSSQTAAWPLSCITGWRREIRAPLAPRLLSLSATL